MKRPKPSIGFCLVCLTYGLTVAFFAWGLSTPPLDRVWQLHHELKIGDVYDLKEEDRELLAAAMARHPNLGPALLSVGEIGIISAHRDGWIETPIVTLVRTPRAGGVTRIVLDVQTPPQHIPYTVALAGHGWRRQLKIVERGRAQIDLPPAPEAPELLLLKLEGKGLRPDPSSLGVRVTFDPPEAVIIQPSGADAEDDDAEDEE